MTRRGLRQVLPALAHFYGIMPWHIDPEPAVLTNAELDAFVSHYARLIEDRDDD